MERCSGSWWLPEESQTGTHCRQADRQDIPERICLLCSRLAIWSRHPAAQEPDIWSPDRKSGPPKGCSDTPSDLCSILATSLRFKWLFAFRKDNICLQWTCRKRLCWYSGRRVLGCACASVQTAHRTVITLFRHPSWDSWDQPLLSFWLAHCTAAFHTYSSYIQIILSRWVLTHSNELRPCHRPTCVSHHLLQLFPELHAAHFTRHQQNSADHAFLGYEIHFVFWCAFYFSQIATYPPWFLQVHILTRTLHTVVLQFFRVFLHLLCWLLNPLRIYNLYARQGRWILQDHEAMTTRPNTIASSGSSERTLENPDCAVYIIIMIAALLLLSIVAAQPSYDTGLSLQLAYMSEVSFDPLDQITSWTCPNCSRYDLQDVNGRIM